MTKLWLVNQLVLFQRMFQLERHPTVLAGKFSDVRVNFQVDVIGGDLVKGLAALFTTPAISTNAMRSKMNVDTVSCFELLSTLITAERSLWNDNFKVR